MNVRVEMIVELPSHVSDYELAYRQAFGWEGQFVDMPYVQANGHVSPGQFQSVRIVKVVSVEGVREQVAGRG